MRMDRDLAEHLARDTGLRPDEISDDIGTAGGDQVSEHLAADTDVDEEEVTLGGMDPATAVIGRLPVD